jgi:hypothetical protein
VNFPSKQDLEDEIIGLNTRLEILILKSLIFRLISIVRKLKLKKPEQKLSDTKSNKKVFVTIVSSIIFQKKLSFKLWRLNFAKKEFVNLLQPAKIKFQSNKLQRTSCLKENLTLNRKKVS